MPPEGKEQVRGCSVEKVLPKTSPADGGHVLRMQTEEWEVSQATCRDGDMYCHPHEHMDVPPCVL